MALPFPSDIRPYLDDPTSVSDETLAARIKVVWVKAALVAPCIEDPAFPYSDEVEAILGPVVARFVRAGVGGVTTHQQTAGPFSESTTFESRFGDRLTLDEKLELDALCKKWRGTRRSRAFSITPR